MQVCRLDQYRGQSHEWLLKFLLTQQDAQSCQFWDKSIMASFLVSIQAHAVQFCGLANFTIHDFASNTLNGLVFHFCFIIISEYECFIRMPLLSLLIGL